jgi:hypothetical protein
MRDITHIVDIIQLLKKHFPEKSVWQNEQVMDTRETHQAFAHDIITSNIEQ